MSALSPAYVRPVPWMMNPLLLLLLLTGLAGGVSGQSAEDSDDGLTHTPYEDEEVSTMVSTKAEEDTDVQVTEFSPQYNDSLPTDFDYDRGNSSDDPSELDVEDDALSPTVILIPVVLVVVIIAVIVCGIAMSRKWNQKMTTSDGMSESYLQASSTEKVPMPMFDDDIPSVLELEMEDMDQWVENQA